MRLTRRGHFLCQPTTLLVLVMAITFASGFSPSADAQRQLRPLTYSQYSASVLHYGGEPGALAVDELGRIFTCKPMQGSIHIADRRGRTLGEIRLPGELLLPSGIALGHDGSLYVADARRGEILVLNEANGPSWQIHAVFGTGFLPSPRGIAIANNHVFIADTACDCVHVFKTDGSLVRVIGGRGIEPGRFRKPLDVAVDDNGFIFVADCDNHRIQKFAPDGKFIKFFGDWGAFPGLFSEPSSIEYFDKQLFVADRLNHRIEVFDPDGNFLDQWGMHAVVLREGEGKIHYPDAIAVHPRGDFAVVSEAFENRAQIFVAATVQDQQASAMPQLKEAQSHFGPGIAVASGRLAVWESESRAVYVFDAAHEIPILITKFGQPGNRPADLANLSSLQFLPGGERLLLNNAAHRTMQVFDIPRTVGALRFDPFLARFVKSVSWSARAATQPLRFQSALAELSPAAVVTSSDGRVFVLDLNLSAVISLSQDLEVQAIWQSNAAAMIRLERPIAAAHFARTDRLFVVDEWAKSVFVFDSNGKIQDVWSRFSGTDESLVRPVSIAIDGDGSVYIVDAERNEIIVFDQQGTLLRRWGQLGMGAGDFFRPWGIAIDNDDRVFVLDYGNHRVQIFNREGTWLGAFSAGTGYTPRLPVPQWMEDWRPPSP